VSAVGCCPGIYNPVEIETAEPVARAASLLREKAGDTIDIAMPREDAPRKGDRFDARVRRGRRGYFAAPSR